MPMHRNVMLLMTGLAALGFAVPSGASAQKYERGAQGYERAPSPGGNREGGNHGGWHHGGGFGTGVGIGMAIGTAIIESMPPDQPPPENGRFIDDGTVHEPVDTIHRHRVRRHVPRRAPPRRTAQRPNGVPPAGETRLVPDEVVIEVANSVSARQIAALQRRFRLQRIESHRFALTGTTFFRWRIPDRRSVRTVIRALERDRVVASAQPNYLYTLQQAAPKAEGDPAQYQLAKLKLPQAHTLARGDDVRVAVIDSAVDLQSPELAGSIAGSFDTLKSPRKAHAHGTAIAALIAGHGKLMGAAPGARILAVRAFDPKGAGAQGTTFNILKGLDWAVAHNARVINMSFAGPT
ncbi:MAG TPA: S8 family serine peptidase, partial [Pseudolabrys sp.]|nr:S8 family serine peptidase [Pseudolabrys sp.]